MATSATTGDAIVRQNYGKKTWFSPKSGTLNSHKNEACLISGQSTNFEVLTRMAQTQITLRQFKMTMVLC
jgi:hypothetical protein